MVKMIFWTRYFKLLLFVDNTNNSVIFDIYMI